MLSCLRILQLFSKDYCTLHMNSFGYHLSSLLCAWMELYQWLVFCTVYSRWWIQHTCILTSLHHKTHASYSFMFAHVWTFQCVQEWTMRRCCLNTWRWSSGSRARTCCSCSCCRRRLSGRRTGSSSGTRSCRWRTATWWRGCTRARPRSTCRSVPCSRTPPRFARRSPLALLVRICSTVLVRTSMYIVQWYRDHYLCLVLYLYMD